MPLTPGSNVSDTIRELHTGNTYKRTLAKFGKGDANRQAVAIALSNARKGRADGGVVGYDMGGGVSPQLMAAMATMSNQGGLPNQFKPGLNAPMGVAPSMPMPNAQMGPMQPSMVPPTGMAQPPSPGMMTTPTNPMSRPLMARGGVPERASGGFSMQKGPNLNPSWETKQEARGMLHTGPVMSSVPGRTDRHNLMVPGSSYVLPSQHVASLGQGNTMAGFASLNRMFGPGGPYGAPSMRMAHGAGAPRPPKAIGMMHNGGYSEGGPRGDGVGKPTPVVLSGGEFVVDPESVRRVGKGNIKNGHAILDRWVMATRKKEIETQKRLPPPAKK